MKYIDITEYIENDQEQEIGKLKIKKLVNKKDIGLGIIGFLIGRAMLLGSVNPFGLAFFAVLSSIRVNKLLLFTAICIGVSTVGDSTSILRNITSIFMFLIVNKLFSKKNKNIYSLAAISSLSIFTTGTVINLYNDFLVYNFFISLFESFISFVAVILFSKSLVFVEGKSDKRIFTNEQVISATVIFILCIMGISEVSLYNFTLKNILIILVILIFSLKSGAAAGSSIGLVSGLIVSLSAHVAPVIIGAYGFCGLMAGVFKDLGKIGSVLGFVLANALITIYANGSTEVLINLRDILGAALTLMIIPSFVITNINNYFMPQYITSFAKKENSEKLKEITIKKLNGFSEAFDILADTFNTISEKNVNINKEDISTLFDEVAERVCKKCTYNTRCWCKEFYNTYQVMFGMLELLEQKGKIDKGDIPYHFREKCVKPDDFINNANFMFELYSQNIIWQKKMSESRALIAQQLEGISKVVEELSQEISTEIFFKPELEKQILVELVKNNIEPEEVMVLENKYGRYEVGILHKACDNKRQCNINIVPAVSKVLGRNMVRENILCKEHESKKSCVVNLAEQQKYRISSGIAKLCKNNDLICGDNSSIINLQDGKAAVVLSDGMGTGKKASKQSNAAIALLEKFLQSGFDRDLAIRLINSVLVLKSAEDSFATIDLSVINMFTGEVEFAKIGAAATFIKRPYKIDVVKSTSLPLGILSNVDIELTKKQLEDGEIIIMVSDGVLDSKKDIVKKEEWIVKELQDTSISNPQELAEYLISKARENLGGKVDDDMTVVVTKIVEKV